MYIQHDNQYTLRLADPCIKSGNHGRKRDEKTKTKLILRIHRDILWAFEILDRWHRVQRMSRNHDAPEQAVVRGLSICHDDVYLQIVNVEEDFLPEIFWEESTRYRENLPIFGQ